MNARELYKAGKLKEAIAALNLEVRDNPGDVQRRTFLFELLAFAGEYDRAEKQLGVLATGSGEAQLGSVVLRAALHAEKTRKDLFIKRDFPAQPGDGDAELSGTWNGQPFSVIADADPAIGPRLEAYAAGAYIWIPFKHIESIECEPPKRVRDLLWIPAIVRTGPAFKMMELGEVLLPALTWDASSSEDEQVRLGRLTNWVEDENGDVKPVGQKMFLVGEEDVPILELRKLEFTRPEAEEATEE
ncbi:MAG TPA: type VI secretion system accessory protein TagJ [Bryobacteraceae bacterium]|nr:type VI secretion system accessory protein TagJ [Bryobacteraceae bacterium]